MVNPQQPDDSIEVQDTEGHHVLQVNPTADTGDEDTEGHHVAS